jgi:glucose-1-phosphate adenylyltransferase
MAVDSVVSGGCIISGAKIARSLLFSNVHVHSYSSIEDSVILPDVEVHQSVRLNRVVVEKRCTLPKGLAVGFDPAEDRKRFYVSERGITLITPEMLGQEVLHQR